MLYGQRVRHAWRHAALAPYAWFLAPAGRRRIYLANESSVRRGGWRAAPTGPNRLYWRATVRDRWAWGRGILVAVGATAVAALLAWAGSVVAALLARAGSAAQREWPLVKQTGANVWAVYAGVPEDPVSMGIWVVAGGFLFLQGGLWALLVVFPLSACGLFCAQVLLIHLLDRLLPEQAMGIACVLVARRVEELFLLEQGVLTRRVAKALDLTPHRLIDPLAHAFYMLDQATGRLHLQKLKERPLIPTPGWTSPFYEPATPEEVRLYFAIRANMEEARRRSRKWPAFLTHSAALSTLSRMLQEGGERHLENLRAAMVESAFEGRTYIDDRGAAVAVRKDEHAPRRPELGSAEPRLDMKLVTTEVASVRSSASEAWTSLQPALGDAAGWAAGGSHGRARVQPWASRGRM